MEKNIILSTDSYKLTHWNQYPEGTETVYSYFESREGAEHSHLVFFGLQYIIAEYLTNPVTTKDLKRAKILAKHHFGNEKLFNEEGWRYIIDKLDGRLPVRIKAVPEGTRVPVGNVLMTVENTDPKCYWLTNALESILTHVWYPSTVATRSWDIKQVLHKFLEDTAEDAAGLDYMLHDFGYRGATGHESAAIGGAGHLVNFVGTDTVPAMLLALDYYSADIETLGMSVPATEHSVMTALGREGEYKVVDTLLDKHPTGILSVVGDSYNIYKFVEEMGTEMRDKILARDGVFVIRPDSITKAHTTPESLTAWIVNKCHELFGGRVNSKGYIVLNPKVRVLWGDGISKRGIVKILNRLKGYGFSAENMVFGMGGGLLQKLDRDTERFAFKSSAQCRNGEWHDIFKDPLDASKLSKKGRLALIKSEAGYIKTVPEGDPRDILVTVYENGFSKALWDFDEVRERAEA